MSLNEYLYIIWLHLNTWFADLCVHITCHMWINALEYGKDMEPAAGEDLGSFQDGFWEAALICQSVDIKRMAPFFVSTHLIQAILEDPRPGFDEALFVEEIGSFRAESRC